VNRFFTNMIYEVCELPPKVAMVNEELLVSELKAMLE
jgi:hypothetical protein